jgi:hypothetical protein
MNGADVAARLAQVAHEAGELHDWGPAHDELDVAVTSGAITRAELEDLIELLIDWTDRADQAQWVRIGDGAITRWVRWLPVSNRRIVCQPCTEDEDTDTVPRASHVLVLGTDKLLHVCRKCMGGLVVVTQRELAAGDQGGEP